MIYFSNPAMAGLHGGRGWNGDCCAYHFGAAEGRHQPAALSGLLPACVCCRGGGGAGPGLLATLLGALAANLLFLAHGGQLEFDAFQTAPLSLFLGIGVAISLLGDRFLRKSTALQNEGRLRRFIDQAPVPIAMFDTEMRYLAASRRWLTDHAISNHRVLGRSHYEITPDLPERWKQVHRRCLAGVVESVDEDLFERADGSRQWLRWEVRPWYGDSGVIGGLIIFSEDIIERVQATEALRERGAFPGAGDGRFVRRLSDEPGLGRTVNCAVKASSPTPKWPASLGYRNTLPQRISRRSRRRSARPSEPKAPLS